MDKQEKDSLTRLRGLVQHSSQIESLSNKVSTTASMAAADQVHAQAQAPHTHTQRTVPLVATTRAQAVRLLPSNTHVCALTTYRVGRELHGSAVYYAVYCAVNGEQTENKGPHRALVSITNEGGTRCAFGDIWRLVLGTECCLAGASPPPTHTHTHTHSHHYHYHTHIHTGNYYPNTFRVALFCVAKDRDSRRFKDRKDKRYCSVGGCGSGRLGRCWCTGTTCVMLYCIHTDCTCQRLNGVMLYCIHADCTCQELNDVMLYCIHADCI